MTKEEKKSENQKLQDKLFVKKESGWMETKNKDEVFSFAKNYMKFLSKSKTEREAILLAKEIFEKNGFKEISTFSKLDVGDKVYLVNKNKNIAAAVIGKETKMNMVCSHVDSPRLDLKPYPAYEDAGFALLKSHYYGGLKKYQWVSRNLALHGVITTKEGKTITLNIGDSSDDPVFMIPDLLPHLAREQLKREAHKIIQGEEMSIIVGNMPINDKDITEKVKFEFLKHLYDKYNITEEDLVASEIEIVPAQNPRDLGFDRSLISAYGHDDRVCAYASIQAILEAQPNSTQAVLLFDKEEIGSEGDTGAKSKFTDLFLEKILKLRKSDETLNEVFHKSKVLSADVTAGLNPNFKDVHDPTNCSMLGNGISIEKYGGGGGKYSTNDASAEYMRYVINLMNKNKVKWQTGELGRIDLGGGGTIAMFLAAKGCEVVDAGPCVLGMHSPLEIVSKFDLYHSYLAYKVFLRE